MLKWLLEIGFNKNQIEEYAKSSNCTLEELLLNSNSQIDNLIKRKILFELKEFYFMKGE